VGEAAYKTGEGSEERREMRVVRNTSDESLSRSEAFDFGFASRHLGPDEEDAKKMLSQVGYESLAQLIDAAIPPTIRLKDDFQSSIFQEPLSEVKALDVISELAGKNKTRRAFIGLGYHDTNTPAVIARNILENPGWYTQYTPYQPEISQGRLEALLNFQTLIAELCGLPIVNASMLDEATAAAEAMTMSYGIRAKKGQEDSKKFFVADHCHPQVIDVVETRAEAVGIEVEVGDSAAFVPSDHYFGALLAYPETGGGVSDLSSFIGQAHEHQMLVTVCADPLALLLLTSPGAQGADIVVGSAQRFGVPMGFGGPHAAFFATKEEYKRAIPGRLVGVSRDVSGKPALRLALQTREQHIRREKATSNICTAQVLLAVMAGMYAVYHGKRGLKKIACDVHDKALQLASLVQSAGIKLENDRAFFDTIVVNISPKEQSEVQRRAEEQNVLLRYFDDGRVGVSVNETTTASDVVALAQIITAKKVQIVAKVEESLPEALLRKDEILTQPVFNEYRSESEFLRYIKRLEAKDLSLTHSMIPLGSCTMKLNATSEMLPVTLPGFSKIHPFAPESDYEGYRKLFSDLETSLAEITGFDAVSLQPNAGSQGEYAGLLAIRGYHIANGDTNRKVCLIPVSAHGTNPASAVMAGMKVVIIRCDNEGNIDLEDLKEKAEMHKDALAALMITYPSTHGVFETRVKEVCDVIHAHGGQVYLDGANLNALVGIARPGDFGADVCHINLHKTFCIPHGGGGPGMGPIGVKAHLTAHLPGHRYAVKELSRTSGAVSAAPWGSASILPISWMYMAMMGSAGMQRATEIAILNANYIAKRLSEFYPVLYQGNAGLVAHECILDVRSFKESAGIEAVDIAKRLMDYGFHAPTMSWPVAGTLMVEPTESESLAELDRFCDAMIAIRKEIEQIEQGALPRDNNPLKHAPHTAESVTAESWDRPYSRALAAFPTPWTRESKFWPSVGRIEDSYGDRNLVCTCPSVEEYEQEQ